MIAHLLAAAGARSSEILAITFTNKAAGEMRERLELMLTGQVECGGAMPLGRPFDHPPGHAATPPAETVRREQVGVIDQAFDLAEHGVGEFPVSPG